jgi:hypothetical protein
MTVEVNLQRFSNIITLAITAEKDLKTITNIAERAAFWSNRTERGGLQQYNPRVPPRTFMSAPEQQDPEEERYHLEHANPTDMAYTFAAKPLFCCNSFLHPTGAIQMPVCFMTKHNQDTSTAQETLMAEAIIAMGTAVEEFSNPLTASSIVEEALRQASGTKIPIKCFRCSGLPKYNEQAYHLWRDYPHKGDPEVYRNYNVNLKKFREERQARWGSDQRQGSQYGNQYGWGPQQYGRGTTMATNWKREGFPSKLIQDQINATADENSSPEIRVTLLASLKTALAVVHLEEEESRSPTKKPKWKKGGLTFLMYMKPENPTTKQKPMTLLGAPPKEKYPFKIAFKLPFISFPIGVNPVRDSSRDSTDSSRDSTQTWISIHNQSAIHSQPSQQQQLLPINLVT